MPGIECSNSNNLPGWPAYDLVGYQSLNINTQKIEKKNNGFIFIF